MFAPRRNGRPARAAYETVLPIATVLEDVLTSGTNDAHWPSIAA